MISQARWALIVAVLAASLAIVGCNSASSDVIKVEGAPPAIDDGQAHHPHHEQLGPHGGHLLDLTPPEYSVEWTHDDEARLVTVFILDKEHKAAVAISADSVTIKIDIDGKITPYTLNAVHASTDDPLLASRFELVSGPLLTSLEIGEGAKAHLEFSVGETTYAGEIEHHAHHDHHH